jgi:hypothetical protein
VPRDPKSGRQKEDNRFYMISQKRYLQKRDCAAPVKKLPDALDVKGEIERAVFKIRPARAGSDGDSEKKERAGNDAKRETGSIRKSLQRWMDNRLG